MDVIIIDGFMDGLDCIKRPVREIMIYYQEV